MAAEETSELLKLVDTKIEQVRTKAHELSFNELLDMYQGEELIINPEYQRLFRWSEGKQSRFIESLILEMPIPPIFVIEQSKGVYELIDGLQRLSSYFNFRNSLPEAYSKQGEGPLRLTECDIVANLNDLSFEELPQTLKLRLKRSWIRVEIIGKDSDPTLRYYMFKRLNTGGEQLSEQEIRNCTIRLLDPTFNDFIIELSKNEDFINCIKTISTTEEEKRFDQELVLRFFSFKNYRENYDHAVGEFMTDYMEQVSDPNSEVTFDFEKEEKTFKKTFAILNASLGEKAFSGYKRDLSVLNRFLSYHYEAFALGIQDKLEVLDPEDANQMEQFGNILDEIKRNDKFLDLTTGGGKITINN